MQTTPYSNSTVTAHRRPP